MNPSGVLLDTGPLVALLSKDDADHERAVELFSSNAPPFRCCEAVVTEACLLMRKVHAAGPAEVISLAQRGVYQIAFELEDHCMEIGALLRRYAARPISLADACLIRCAEIYEEPRILTFDSDFGTYRWSKRRKFDLL